MTLRDLCATTATLLILASPLEAAEGGEAPRIINFAIVAAVLFFLLRKPLAEYLTARAAQIREELAQAKVNRERGDKARLEAEARLETLDAQVAKAREEARQAAEAEGARIVKNALGEAAHITALAKKEIDAELEAGRRKLLARAAELSVELAQQEIQSKMTKEDQANLVDRSIALMGEKL